jgi:hypothetical protein
MELTDTALRVLGLDVMARGKVKIESGGRYKMGYEWALAASDGMVSKHHVSLFVESESPVPFVSLENLIEELNRRFIFYKAIEICGVSSFDGVLAVVLHDATVHNSRVTLSTFETENVVEWGE